MSEYHGNYYTLMASWSRGMILALGMRKRSNLQEVPGSIPGDAPTFLSFCFFAPFLLLFHACRSSYPGF